jgi:hypothetical protein
MSNSSMMVRQLAGNILLFNFLITIISQNLCDFPKMDCVRVVCVCLGMNWLKRPFIISASSKVLTHVHT